MQWLVNKSKHEKNNTNFIHIPLENRKQARLVHLDLQGQCVFKSKTRKKKKILTLQNSKENISKSPLVICTKYKVSQGS